MLSRRIAFYFYAVLYFAPFWVIAQGDTTTAAKWHFRIEHQEGNDLRLVATGEVRQGWGVFSLAMPDDMPHTRWVIDTTEGNRLIGEKERNAPVRERSELLSTDIAYHKGTIVLEALVQTSGKPVKGALSYMAFRGEEFTNPVEVPFRIVPDAQGKYQLVSAELAASALASQKIKRATIDMDHPVANCGGTGAEGPKSLWRIFMLGVLGGLLGLVMPCTFPMIPMTVSFFTKKSNDHSKGIRNAFLYGFFIFLIYVLISIPFYFLEAGNEDILNNISTNAWLNLLFALIFFLFALSFFGLYEIGLPSSFANKVDARSNLGSVGGIFFMALTLAIVSFSCTGPILGTLLVGALNEEGGALQLTIAMAGFGLALGLPFGLFAMFPRWLAKLPRSGSWMNTVKMVFAFIELALMVKFLSNADLVMHWGLLKREVFIGIWIILSLLTSLYLFGIVRFRHDPPPPRLSQGRIMSAILFLLFTVYLLPGVSNTRYANLSLISGFPPPLSYSIYGHGSAKGKGVEAMVVNDYEKALQMSRETGKPVLLDFTGWACVNCRKMEENVWPDPRIRELIEKNFILVSLYVDDRKVLPDDQQFLHTLSDGSTKKIRTVGDLYATMQSENFRNASQPLYAILNADEQLLNLPVGYTPNANAYLQWLECGLSPVKKQ
jgi:thiol:disulfide interchange protein DsbD